MTNITAKALSFAEFVFTWKGRNACAGGRTIADRQTKWIGSDEMNQLVIPNVSVEAVLMLASIVVTLFAPWSAGLLWFASWDLGGLDAG